MKLCIVLMRCKVVDWTHLAWDSSSWRDPVTTIMEFRIVKNDGGGGGAFFWLGDFVVSF